MGKIDQLIINSPYKEPMEYWKHDSRTDTFVREEGRRPSGYTVINQKFINEFIPIPLVNKIREKLKDWKKDDYKGITSITRRLLEHWHDPEQREGFQFFYCQIEAIETLIWWIEAPEEYKEGISISSDGGDFQRICSKMATGTGKTVVMCMLIAWQILNKVTYSQDLRFSKNVFVVAPGLTVKNRLQVLKPSEKENYYEQFNIIPTGLMESLLQGKIIIENWHTLSWDSEQNLKNKKSVDKRGAKSDKAYVKDILGEMSNSKSIIVINDEAHHAWRINPEDKLKNLNKSDIDEATVWINGLDRIHNVCGILNCFDFSATPFLPTGKTTTQDTLFSWIISDFSLNDSIESGLVKTPRVVIRDNALPDVNTYKSKLYHIYPHVKDDILRNAEPEESLSSLIINAYDLLGIDWLETKKSWEENGLPIPPVMISVVNKTQTAKRIKYAFDHKRIQIDELCVSEKILHIDSEVLKKVEDGIEQEKSKREFAEGLREKVDTVGQIGKAGEQIQNVISVGMLSEGWDAKTVTHIMGLRAFSSQLLCEQVVGRGLRRTSYEINPDTGLFDAEHVNIFGIPFSILPYEENEKQMYKVHISLKRVEPLKEKEDFEISYPNIIRIEHVFKPKLMIELDKIEPLILDTSDSSLIAELSPILDGNVDSSKISEINLFKSGYQYRHQEFIFKTAVNIYDQMKKEWKGNKSFLVAQLVKIIDIFVNSKKCIIKPLTYNNDEVKRRVILKLNMPKIEQHLKGTIHHQNAEDLIPVFERLKPICSTKDMIPWNTKKPCQAFKKCHINYCVFDSSWEQTVANALDHDINVKKWVKNDHLGFEIPYFFQGNVHKYKPDFILEFINGNFMIIEVKGQEDEKDKAKKQYLDDWVKAVNSHGGFGNWYWRISKSPTEVIDILNDFNK